MRFIGDFHIHSHFSIATSKNLVPELLEYWAKLKGITVVGTGDFTHPAWLEELKVKLKPSEPGLYVLKEGLRAQPFTGVTPPAAEVRFMLTAEISTIYKKDGKVRKVHNLIFAPDFQTVEKIQGRLSNIGNITSDGRPILGFDSRDLLELVLECSDRCFFVPSHIWTPWFSALGAKSGFDSIDACYGDLSEHIFAIETGLSSDPPMNWLCSFLDRFTIISNSDAHSPEKLGREANLFDTALDYGSITGALKDGGEGFRGTVEFFPQEGKYHYDGHRKCGIRLNPLESLRKDGICPECGKKLTIGVLSRVAQLADRDEPRDRQNRHPFHSLIPLKELLSEINRAGVQSKKVRRSYDEIVGKCGSELGFLIDCPVDEIRSLGGELVAEGIDRMRSGKVHIEEGYDGEYGRIRVFREDEIGSFGQEASLFTLKEGAPAHSTVGTEGAMREVPLGRSMTLQRKGNGFFDFDIHEYRKLRSASVEGDELPISIPARTLPDLVKELNPEQQRAAMHATGPALVLAGPGTGKTRVLTCRAARLIHEGVDADSILAVTFSNRAAEEMRKRIAGTVKGVESIRNLHIKTFHAFGLDILKGHLASFDRSVGFAIFDDNDSCQIIEQITDLDSGDWETIRGAISREKRRCGEQHEKQDPELGVILHRYEETLIKHNAFDFDDLICKPVSLLREFHHVLQVYRERYGYVLIDEYQDINQAQYELVRLLMPGPEANLFAIGDPDQAIYGFRGADVGFINRFLNDYPGAAVYSLKKSYRCSSFILKASQGMMGCSEGKPGFLEGFNRGIKVKITEQASDKSEAEFVARTIERMMGGLRFFSMDSDISEGSGEQDIQSLSDFAVLCRVREQMRPMVKAFENHSIPHQVIGTTPFYREEPVSSVIDLLKFSIMPANTLLRDRLVQRRVLNINESLANRWDGWLVKDAAKNCAAQFFHEERLKKDRHFQKLFDLCGEFGTDMHAFFEYVVLGAGTDAYRRGFEQVVLMTIHAAKGLEFPCVFIIGCEDGVLPYSLFAKRRADVEEERRLLYVGMTRAQKYLILSHARKKFMFGKSHSLGRSRFLDTIEEELLDFSQGQYTQKSRKPDNQLELF
jgi:uncharacterized protein (TIGR00375 family)